MIALTRFSRYDVPPKLAHAISNFTWSLSFLTLKYFLVGATTYVRVIQKNRQMAWALPFWANYEENGSGNKVLSL